MLNLRNILVLFRYLRSIYNTYMHIMSLSNTADMFSLGLTSR